MRIGLVTGEYPPTPGGVGDFTCRLAETLAIRGHAIHIITGEGPSPAENDEAFGIRVHRVIEDWRWGCWRSLLEVMEPLDLDVVNLQYQAAAYDLRAGVNFLPREGRPPVVVTFHDLRVPYMFPKAGPLRRLAVRMLAQRADRVIVTNREDYLELEDVIPSSQLRIVPIGSNIPASPPAGYDRDAKRAQWGLDEHTVLLGYFGFLNQNKGGRELIQALAALVDRGMDAHLLMIGRTTGGSTEDIAYANQVRQLIETLDLEHRVHWTGYVESKEVSASLLATDVCVLPFRDGASFRRGTLHACLAHGRAIVTTTPSISIPEIKDRQNMYLVPPESPTALANAVEDIVSHRALRERLKQGAAQLASEFTWDEIARKTARIIRELVMNDVAEMVRSRTA